MSARRKARAIVDNLAISVRAYVPSTKQKPFPRTESTLGPSDWVLVFDAETTTDARQALRFGAYQVRKHDQLSEAGIFVSGEELTEREQAIVRKYASSHGLEVMSKEEFVEKVLYGIGYDLRATIVGFNLPFDLSRLAIDWGKARGKTMRGGFTFKLSNSSWRPQIQIKHLNARASLIQFTWRRKASRGMRKRRMKVTTRRGPFIDVKTLAAALTSQSFTLGALADFLKTEHRKGLTEEHGSRLTNDYIDYAVQDVQVTWECYRALIDRFHSHGLTHTRVSQVLSEASLGKAYLREMGIRPWREVQPRFPHELLGFIMSTYCGGRSEVHLRRVVSRVLYCDFLSMYPTVCTLMNLWQSMTARGMTWRESTSEVQALLERVGLDDLQRPETWRLLTVIVQVRPEGDIFPVRANYGGGSNETIGVNYLTSETPLWYTLADCIASKLLTGKPAKILRAIRFEPVQLQDGLVPIKLAGNPDYSVDPRHEDFFRRVIDLRNATKARLKTADDSEKANLECDQQALKILANATSYGIFVELIVEKLDPPEQRMCFGPGCGPFPVLTRKGEEPGPYFHPLLATLITGAARLMLAVAETLATRNGLDWAFCDTDSMAFAKPEAMANRVFLEKVDAVRNWFEPLSPYESKEPLLKFEGANYSISDEPLQAPLYCYAISAKRYVLFNLGADGQPIIRKASAHGLGHLLPPYGEADAPKSISAPSVPLMDIGIERWQYDLWYKIIQAGLAGHPDRVDLSYHPPLKKPAASRYAATTPRLLRWFKRHNLNRTYRDQVRPFNFLMAFQALSAAVEAAPVVLKPRSRQRTKKGQGKPKPIAPYSTSIAKAASRCFDRETGEPVSVDCLKSYRHALAQYHLSAESKFLNGDYLDRGPTRRRHVQAVAINHIGKEANRWEEQFYLGLNVSERIEYGEAPLSAAQLEDRLRDKRRIMSQRELAKAMGISRATLSKLLNGKKVRNSMSLLRAMLTAASVAS